MIVRDYERKRETEGERKGKSMSVRDCPNERI